MTLTGPDKREQLQELFPRRMVTRTTMAWTEIITREQRRQERRAPTVGKL
jgi:hypothetical protein